MKYAVTMACALAAMTSGLAQNQQYTAKIVVESGAALPMAPNFIAPPAGHDLPRCIIRDTFANGVVSYIVPLIEEPGEDAWSRRLDDKCEITILLKGYRKQTVTLHQGAVIVLKGLGDPEGSTVSVSALHVPKDAAKAYDKGIAAMGDDKPAAAQKQFERAVELYPDYAQAWSRLCEAREQQSQLKEAADAGERALKADPKYPRPYLQLLRIAVHEKRWEDAAALGERAMALNPVEFIGIFYYDAVANYELKHLDVAGKMAKRAVDLDKAHEYPDAEAVLGKVLAEKGETRGAIDHFTQYVLLAPKAEDTPAIRQRIADLQQKLEKTN
ncbi:MAG TPA: tetratricopeptide repeat protein [Bryobacteraceae bacterium]|nr:tetratricopeptide repeat protein [Bryobacteraceae bacterium]